MSHDLPTTQTINMAISILIHISFSIIIIINIPIVHHHPPAPVHINLPPTDPVEAPGCHRVVLDLLKLVLA